MQVQYSSRTEDIFCIISVAKHIGVSLVSELYEHDQGRNIGITLQVKKSIRVNER